jgi:hypothetical protein
MSLRYSALCDRQTGQFRPRQQGPQGFQSLRKFGKMLGTYAT